ncbi:MAG: thioredoxin-dependent thiol peroxidase [Chthoniobacteraceae bacterium]
MKAHSTLQPGNPAPGFTATAVGGIYGLGAPVSLKDFAGQTVILYFYPKDDTPGCTLQACGLRDGWNQFSERAVVLGISPDPVEQHEKFIAKYELPFPLVSDESKEICQAYGVWVEKINYGKKYMGVERSTFIIGADGTLKAIFRKVKPEEHVEKLLSALE